MTKAFYARASDFFGFDSLPDFARKELSSATNEGVALGKRAAYGLLQRALDSLGFEGARIVRSIEKNAYGKPVCKEVEFSLSHTQGVVAVAISSRPVGIDVETLCGRKISDFSFALTTGEKVDGDEEFLSLWTKKEAIFKRRGNEKRFQPKNIFTARERTATTVFTIDGKTYALSVATDEIEDLEILFI